MLAVVLELAFELERVQVESVATLVFRERQLWVMRSAPYLMAGVLGLIEVRPTRRGPTSTLPVPPTESSSMPDFVTQSARSNRPTY